VVGFESSTLLSHELTIRQHACWCGWQHVGHAGVLAVLPPVAASESWQMRGARCVLCDVPLILCCWLQQQATARTAGLVGMLLSLGATGNVSCNFLPVCEGFSLWVEHHHCNVLGDLEATPYRPADDGNATIIHTVVSKST
jgi:hypothetical protein